jgi:phospholipid transport system substrate-binding protein
MIKNRFLIIAISLTLLTTAVGAAAADMGPLNTIKAPIDKVIALLTAPQYAADDHRQEQRDKMWNTAKEMFDFVEISKRALAREWRNFSPAERKEFTDVFSRFLGNTYMDKIQGEYHNEKIVYVGEELFRADLAMAKTLIVRESVEIPVDYRMKKIDGAWKVYDVNVEGISLVKNYRSQFSKILEKEKPQQLIDRLKKKLAK